MDFTNIWDNPDFLKPCIDLTKKEKPTLTPANDERSIWDIEPPKVLTNLEWVNAYLKFAAPYSIGFGFKIEGEFQLCIRGEHTLSIRVNKATELYEIIQPCSEDDWLARPINSAGKIKKSVKPPKKSKKTLKG